tara:strand:- start:30 stop:548 length:519 start_codon:yes stop_codon:yes gene_type:complete
MRLPLLLVAASPAAAEDALDLLWPSPLLNFYDLLAQRQNAALKKLIMRVARNSSGVSKTNIGGWQSDAHFLERTEASVAILRTRAYHAVFRYLQASSSRCTCAPSAPSAGHGIFLGRKFASPALLTAAAAPRAAPHRRATSPVPSGRTALAIPSAAPLTRATPPAGHGAPRR